MTTVTNSVLGAMAIDPSTKILENVEALFGDREGWEFIGGLSEWEGLSDWVKEETPAVIFVNIDEGLEQALEFASEVDAASPLTVLLGVSEGQTGDGEDKIIRCLRAGFGDFLKFPFDRTEVTAVLGRIREKRGGGASRPRGQVITLFSPRGGSGLTTLTVNLAIFLAKLNLLKVAKKRVGLLDLDLELGDVPFFLNLSPTMTIGDVVSGGHMMDRGVLTEAFVPHVSGVEVLSAPLEIHQAEAITEEAVGEVIEGMRSLFDFILIDTPRNFSPITLRALDAADAILLLTLPHLAAIADAKRTLDVFKQLGYDKRVNLVINRLSTEDDITVEQVEKTLGMPVYMTLPSDYRQVMPAINRGLSLWEYAPRSQVTRAILKLAQKISGLDGSKNGHFPNAKKKRWFKFF